jgi:hypothetical protein
MATIFKNAREWIAVFFAVSLLAACGGGSSTADTTPPTVSAFSVTNGAAITASSDASYAVSGNVGTTQQYTVTFSEKLDATSYTVKMLDTNNSPVALPSGMTATLAANDPNNLAYTLTITTSGSFAFDAGQTSKAVKLQTTVADASNNVATVNVTETVNMVAPTIASNQPASITQDAGGNSSITISLASYMQTGWVIVVDNVTDSSGNTPLGSVGTVSGNSVILSIPGGYGFADVTATVHYHNNAGNSQNFTVKGTTLLN